MALIVNLISLISAIRLMFLNKYIAPVRRSNICIPYL